VNSHTLLVDPARKAQWGRDVLLLSGARKRFLIGPEYDLDSSKVELRLTEVDEQLARVIEHDGGELELELKSGCAVRPGPEFDEPSAIIELYTGVYSAMVPAERGEEGARVAHERLVSLGLNFDGLLLDELWRRQVRKRGDDADKMTRRPPWHYETGNVLAWVDVCKNARRDRLAVGEEYVSVFDCYCPSPECSCAEALVSFETNPDNPIGTVKVRFATGTIEFEPDSSMEQLREVWAAYTERWPNYLEVLPSRYKRLRAALHDVLVEEMRIDESFTVSVNPQRRGEPKVGRNKPCPCGSGRKYKRCCGR